jgi:sigma-E factor negative regulatory protein RseA
MAAHSSKLAIAVSARLADEPFILATPRRPLAHVSIRRAASLAAAVAGVAVVGFVALQQLSVTNGSTTQIAGAVNPSVPASASRPPPAGAYSPVPPVAAPVVSREFLAAHRQYSGGIAMQGMVGQVRNVALETGR